MIELDEFIKNPTKPGNEHPAYMNAFFRMVRSPEYATGEVVISSLYRTIGFSGVSEKNVGGNGKKFAKLLSEPKQNFLKNWNQHHPIDLKTWRRVVNDVLMSPKQPNQSKQRFLQITPLVPETAIYTSAARLQGNPWDPGAYIKEIFDYSPQPREVKEAIWKSLFDCLAVDHRDDLWARFISFGLRGSRPTEIKESEANWEFVPLSEKTSFPLPIAEKIVSPAWVFLEDLPKILELKEQLTRRQWTSALESMLRLCVGTHAMWNAIIHEKIRVMLFEPSAMALEPDDICLRLSLRDPDDCPWKYGGRNGKYDGSNVLKTVQKIAQDYFISRISINYLIHEMHRIEKIKGDALSTPEGLCGFCHLAQTFIEKNKDRVNGDLFRLREAHQREISCKKGIPSNLVEFVRYTLGQRQTAESEMKNYDQGYFAKKKGDYRNAPWVVSFGPLALMMLVHCCSVGYQYPKTVIDFKDYLARYGIDAGDIASNELGSILRHLGLVVDSPDAEGGMVIISPFKATGTP